MVVVIIIVVTVAVRIRVVGVGESVWLFSMRLVRRLLQVVVIAEAVLDVGQLVFGIPRLRCYLVNRRKRGVAGFWRLYT